MYTFLLSEFIRLSKFELERELSQTTDQSKVVKSSRVQTLKPAAHGACFFAGLLACSYVGYLAGYLAGNGLSAGSAARFSAGFS